MERSTGGLSSQRVRQYLASRVDPIPPQSAEEYFTILLDRAARASSTGDYGISAALVVRYGDVEIVSVASNTVLSRRDPFGHAEANAIRQFQNLMAIDAGRRAEHMSAWRGVAEVLASPRPHEVFLRTGLGPQWPCMLLYATLEPCPMCTVAILTSHIDRVVIAIPDEPGGALAPERLAKLPPIWPQIARSHLRVSFTNQAENDIFVPAELSALLHSVFWDTKGERDSVVSDGVLLDPDLQALINARSAEIPT
jgi:tRNA(Arg) A34 adenosine deaminase TadA